MELESQFNSFHPKIKSLAKRYARETSIPAEDFESAMCEGFWVSFETYDANKNDNFDAFIFSKLKKRAIDVIRSKYGKSWQRSDYLEDKLPANCEGMNAVEVLVIADTNTESSAIERLDGDKLQLIKHLTSGSDSFTIAVVKELLETGQTIKGVSTRLGVHNYKTSRALRKLHKRYDEKKFGDYRSYIA